MACTDPTPMLLFLRGRASDRKLRLFACACCRLVWHLIPDWRSRGAVLTAERSADGLAGEGDLRAARAAAPAAGSAPRPPVRPAHRAWPDVALPFRGDSGFGVPALYDVREGPRVGYPFGLSTNAVLQRETEGLLAEAVSAYERERQAARQQDPPRPAAPSRFFTGFWYQAGTWPQPRWVVAKAEANDRGTNRRFVVTNRPGAVVLPGPTYDEYAERGESENRNEQFKGDRAMDH
jgi:hypothetical protein